MRVLGIFCILSTAWGADAAHDAAAKAIALIQASQKNWTQDCDSCHQQLLPQIAFRAARVHGIPVDEQLAHASAARTFGMLANLDRAVQYTHLIDPAISDGYTLLAADAAGVKPSLTTAIYARHIASRQKADGHWETLDVRPPQSYSMVTATAVAARAVQLYSHPGLAAETKARLDKARSWLASVNPNSTEERVMQLRGLSWTGGDRAMIAKLSQGLLATQQSDGGWNSRDGLPSDAYSTGETLVALAQIDPGRTAETSWKHGIQFLLRTQAADGSWHVRSRIIPPAPVSPPYFETGYPYGHDQFISAMGAAWAVQALALSLPAVPHPTAALTEAVPGAVEPWVATALFGSTADLRAALDKGLDANSATKSGGTTLLMLAQPDVEKTRLLVERGAKVNARARTKFSALMVAAQYSDSAPVMEFLLDHGAEVQMPKGAGTPLFNASPMVLAAGAGNGAILPRLRKAGADPESKMLMLGTFSASPLLIATFDGDANAARAALDSGAKVDSPDDDGITALEWAAIGNQTGVAKILIEHGANVNHVDTKGMTALLYAASIDFGDAAMIQLLLKSGASPTARSKEGLTASEIARKYGHQQVLKSLPTGP